MNKKTLQLILPLVLLILITSGLYFFVFHKNYESQNSKNTNNFKVGVVMPSSWFSFVDNSTIDYPQHIKDAFWQTFKNSGFQDTNIDIESATTLGDQALKIQSMIKNNIQAIIISPVMDESSLPNLLGLTIPNPYAIGKDTNKELQKLKKGLLEAKAAGIKIIGWQNFIAGIEYDLFIQSPTANQMGANIGQWLKQINTTNNKKTMEIILPEINVNNYSKNFFTGLYSQIDTDIKKNIYISHNITVDLQATDYEQFCLTRNNDKKNTTASDEQNESHLWMNKILVQNYNLSEIYNFNPASRPDIIVAGSDQIAQGVIDSLKDKGFTPSYDSDKWPTIIGVGGLKTAIWNISNSYQTMTVIYDSNQLVDNTVSVLLDLLSNLTSTKYLQSLPKININNKEVSLITTKPISIDKHNEKSELIDKGYITPGEAGL
ncbi:MAG: substrate-binding domain-containing protein [Bifidobacteriaceae bacterium]|jgi:ABC-type xylose transport system substrate-binding protein|nr:substrate-binding domain-containing protein [Bifidobacteriaceae bacterium]